MQRPSSISSQVVHPHQPLVGALARLIETQDARATWYPDLIVVMRLAVSHQLVQRRQVDVLKPLVLEQTPVLVTTLQQVPLVEVSRMLQNHAVEYRKITFNWLRVLLIGRTP